MAHEHTHRNHEDRTRTERDADPRDRRAEDAHKGGNMHEGTEVWTDTCSCEPEPRWQRLAEEPERDRND